MKKNLIFRLMKMLALPLALLFATACSDDTEEPVPAPVAGFTASSTTIGVGGTVTFTNTSTDATAFQWAFGDGATSSEQSPSHTYTAAGSYTVTMIATGPGGTDQATQTISVEVVAEPVSVYFTDNAEDIFTMKKLSGIGLDISVETAFNTTGFAMHAIYGSSTGKVYYSDDDNGQIVQVNLDGSSETVVMSGLDGPRGLALNDDESILYIAERFTDRIHSLNLSSGNSQVLYEIGAFGLPAGEAALIEGLDYYNGQLYLTCVEFDAESVWRGNADGSSASLENLIDYFDGGYGYSIVIDGANNRMFFDDDDAGTIRRADLNGGNISNLTPRAGRTHGLAIDGTSGLLYIGDGSGSIKRVGLDGTGQEVLLEDENLAIRGLFIVRD